MQECSRLRECDVISVVESISNVVNETVRVHASACCCFLKTRFFLFSRRHSRSENPILVYIFLADLVSLCLFDSKSPLSVVTHAHNQVVELQFGRFPVKNWRALERACSILLSPCIFLFYYFHFTFISFFVVLVLLIYRLLFWACSCRHRWGFRFSNGAWLSASSLDYSGSIRRAVASGPKRKIHTVKDDG